MTNRSLRRHLVLTSAVVILCLAASAAEYIYKRAEGPTFVSSNATLLAILFGAYIAYLFQQRSKAVDDLRHWWNEIVKAKSDLHAYCDKQNPTEDDYFRVFGEVSTAMDTLRLIYSNVDRTDANPRGYYPFEQVRDIVDIARSIAPNRQASFEDRKRAKLAIDIVFRSLRHAIQAEAAASPPDTPTLQESRQRKGYLAEVRARAALDIEAIRQENKKFH